GILEGSGTVTGALSGAGGIVQADAKGTLDLKSDIVASTGLDFIIGGNTNASTLQLDGALGTGNTFTFEDNNDILAYNHTGGITTTLIGMAVSTLATPDPLNFTLVDYKDHTVTVSGSNEGTGTSGSFTLSDGSVLTLNSVVTNGAGTWFVETVSDGGSGTDVFLSTACFVVGTRIATPNGEMAVEALHEGDLVTTLAGEAKRIRWIGRGDAPLSDANRCDLAPVIVRRDALGPGMPSRDLHLTRKHAVLVEDVLVPVELLVNDHSIVWDNDTTRVLYYHVELDDHDVLLAN